MNRLLPLPLVLSACLGITAQAADDQPVTATITGHVYRPAAVEPTAERLAGLQLPEGFRIDKFAEGLEGPRMLAVADDGRVYVSQPKAGQVLLLEDTDGDGRADRQQAVAQREQAHGLTLHDGRLYIATVHEVLAGEVREDGSIGELQVLTDQLPPGGQHANRTLAFGPDGQLYITVGSLANAFPTPVSDKTATMLRTDPENFELTVFAEGLRNTLGFDWHPHTAALWGMDHGIDWLGDVDPPEELNQLTESSHYGWPYVWGDGNDVPQNSPPDTTLEQFKEKAESPVLGYTPHSAPMQMVFYTGKQFPQEYQHDAFIAMRGSWNRQPPSGYEVVRIVFDDNGQPTGFEPFLTGFLVEQENGEYVHFGRPVGLAQLPDGSLLVGDDTKGVIYRISYEG